MKTKWYFFTLTILMVSVFVFSLVEKKEDETVQIGVLMVGDNRYQKFEGLTKGLNDLGYKDNDITYIVKNAKDNQDTLQQQIHSLLLADPDVIVTLGGLESSLLKEELNKQNKKTPVVFAGVADPKELGLIEDYRTPGGQFTGINNYHTSISGKRLEMLTDLVPTIKIVHVLYDSQIQVSQSSLMNTEEAARKLNVVLSPYDINLNKNLNNLRDKMKEDEGILVLPSFRIESLTNELAALTKDKQIPAMGLYEFEAEYGLLASYGASFYSQGYQASRFVSLILKGNNPAELPVELPDSIRFVINQETKQQLNVRFDQDLLSLAEYIQPVKNAEGGK